MPNKQINLPFYRTKPIPEPMRGFLKKNDPGADVDGVRLHGWSPMSPLGNGKSITIGKDIFLANRRLFNDPGKDPEHILHEFKHTDQDINHALYGLQLIHPGYWNIPVEKEARAYAQGLLRLYGKPESKPGAGVSPGSRSGGRR